MDWEKEELVLLETDVDDCTPEELSLLQERLMEKGVLEVTILPQIMKKGRMGNLIRVLTTHKRAKADGELLMLETGTLGVRKLAVERIRAFRKTFKKEIEVNGEREEIRIKESSFGQKPEFDDVRFLSMKYDIPFHMVNEIIEKQLD